MKLRKFFGLTSRSVLEQVRTELGPDAVIVANHATAEGVEVTALAGDAIDSILGRREEPPKPETKPAEPPRVPDVAPTPRAEPRADAIAWQLPIASPRETPPPATFAPPSATFAPPPVLAPAVPAATVATPAEAPLPSKVMEEVAAMRGLIEERLSLIAFNDTLRRRPLAAKLSAELLASGYSAQLARELTKRLPDDFTAAEAEQWIARVLARNLACVPAADEIVGKGGVYALVGPTGVGKTTTTAKLAARCALRYGASKLALITTDGFRIGAQDQLRVYAKILGVALHTVADRHELAQALDACKGRHLVLIDTVGIGQRDTRVAEQALLLGRPEIRQLLLLNATAQGETLEEVVAAYRRPAEPGGADPIAGCIVTKIDEATRTGAAIDIAVRHRLAVHYVTNGQRVPEDVFIPESELLVHRSLKRPAKSSPFALADDELPLAIGQGAGATAGALHA